MTVVSFRTVRVLLAAVFVAALTIPALAVEQTVREATYDVTIKPQTGTGHPRTGVLTLKFHEGGIVNGEYRGTSIAPDPLNNHITRVSGGVQEQKIWIQIGNGPLRFTGTMENGNLTMSGWINGRPTSLTGARVH